MSTVYKIVTTSTGGSDAAIKVEKYVSGSLIATVNMRYQDYNGSWRNFDDLFKVGYSTVQGLNWTCQITGSIQGHNVGENINWLYNAWQDLTLTATGVDGLFLLEDSGSYYTVQNHVLVDIGTTLNAALFTNYGMQDIPDCEDFSSLHNPYLLKHKVSDFTFTALISGTVIDGTNTEFIDKSVLKSIAQSSSDYATFRASLLSL